MKFTWTASTCRRSISRFQHLLMDRQHVGPATGCCKFVALSEFLPEPPATAVDLAGGTGGTALWLAVNGYDTTLVDISPVALNVAEKEAIEKKVLLTTICHDLESAKPLGSLWDIAVCCNFYGTR